MEHPNIFKIIKFKIIYVYTNIYFYNNSKKINFLKKL